RPPARPRRRAWLAGARGPRNAPPPPSRRTVRGGGRSHVEEHGLVLPLEHDVETVTAVGHAAGDEGRAPIRGDHLEDRVLRVRGLVVAAEARDEAPEAAATQDGERGGR